MTDLPQENVIIQENPEPASSFTHLHVHTQFSVLDGAAPLNKLIKKAKSLNMNALAITDHGNMYGVQRFVKEALNNKIKPIIGCEVYITDGSRFEKKGKEDRSGYHLILLAKNLDGYKNLSKLSSLAFIEGFYYTPRIDKEILKKYSKNLIALSACLGGEIPSAILEGNMPKAEELVKEYKSIFNDDFYLELQNHGLEDQVTVNKALVNLAEKYNVKLVATNDVHFINAEDAEAHDILVCMNTKRDLNDPTRMKYSGQEYLKTAEEMQELFKNIPEAIANTQEIINKIETIILKRDIILPHFPLPPGFENDDEYLSYLTNNGAANLYPEITPEIRERIDYELAIVTKMGFAGYFLIVQDFINEAKKMGVAVGPGRGSAAGSIVAFCTGITSVDPIKYNLLFERFLNPERISMPDVDIDFDDSGRDKVIQYVIDKYGKEKVAQIVTFGSMAAKSAVKSVARVIGLPLAEASRLSNLIPGKPGTTLESAFKEIKELSDELNSSDPLVCKTLRMAEFVEGLYSHVGVHACGVIIGPENLIEHIPLSKNKDSELLVVTQYDGKFIEEVGMLKMDFLGLKTLSIIKDAIENIYLRHHKTIELDNIPLDDKKTFELYSKGDTVGTFQFESSGMQIYLRELKPTDIEDLITMNALYRPGPMDNIPSYIRRKNGKEKAEYLHPIIKSIVGSTYGIMIFQEQIMQIAQKMGGFTLGKADILRKAMGKKDKVVMQKQFVEFVEGAKINNIDEETAKKVWDNMEKFAEYGFNRSHSAAYSILAYKTAYLKANYPAEYMAAVLTHNLNDIKKITNYIGECLRSNIPVYGPDINESRINFTVNQKGIIRFGLGAIKNVGENAALSIIEEREANGPYINFFDFIKRSNLRNVNKRCIESLVQAGAFDCFTDAHRAQYFYKIENEDVNFIEKTIRFGNTYQTNINSSQQSLFGEESVVSIDNPQFPFCEQWSQLEQLKNEKDVIGFFITGHPLDNYILEINKFCNVNIVDLKDNYANYKDKDIRICGICSDASHKIGKTGKPYCSFTLEDMTANMKFNIFGPDYLKFKNLIENDYFLYVKAVVQNRYNSNELELKIYHISLLADLLNENVKNISLQFNLHELNEIEIDAVADLIVNNPGKCKLSVIVFDPENRTSLNMFSRKGVNAPNLLKSLSQFENIKFNFD
ncbi:MAG: DNA polymerase III subunit alpha [Bacteroidales bacterium]|nr:DNA polymerase III subunit alpha [Bacteroidales bacterium]